jgi:hypothetical protein
MYEAKEGPVSFFDTSQKQIILLSTSLRPEVPKKLMNTGKKPQ